MANFWRIVNNVIEKSDILLEVLDARLIDATRNVEVEQKVENKGKKLIYVINKCDLVEKEELEREIKRKKLFPSVFVSTIKHYGTTILRDMILRFGDKEEVVVGVLGYPNTGKSSLINALKGKASAKASSQSGFTKALQMIRMDKRIMLLDTPGVIPYKEKDEKKHILISTKDFTKVKDAEFAAIELIEELDGAVEQHYGVEKREDAAETIEEIAFKNNKLLKGGKPNIDLMSRTILKDWQTGLIKR